MRVFTDSLSDFFLPAADKLRPEIWNIIKMTPHCIYMILSKRPELIAKRLPPDWPYPNVWLGVSSGCRQTLNKMDSLREIVIHPSAVLFLSAEPLLEDISRDINLDGFGSVICGGESGGGPEYLWDASKDWRDELYTAGRRTMKLEWAHALRELCEQKNIPFWFKQITAAKSGQGEDALGRIYQNIPDPPYDVWLEQKPSVPEPTSLVTTPLVTITPLAPVLPVKVKPPNPHLLPSIEKHILTYVYFPDPEHYSLVLSLYCMLSGCWLDCFSIVPYMMIVAREEDAGKSTLTKVLCNISVRGRLYGRVSPALLCDHIDLYRPTVFIDEFGKFSKWKDDDMDIFHHGYDAETGFKENRGGREGKTRWLTFCPKVVGRVGFMSDEMMVSRCIGIFLEKIPPQLKDTIIDYDANLHKAGCEAFREPIQEWCEHNSDAIRTAFLNLHDKSSPAYKQLDAHSLATRGKQIWTPLIAICTVIAPHRLPELYGAIEYLDSQRDSRKRQPDYIYTVRDKGAVYDRSIADRILVALPAIFYAHAMRNKNQIFMPAKDWFPMVYKQEPAIRAFENAKGKRFDISTPTALQQSLEMLGYLFKDAGYEVKAQQCKYKGKNIWAHELSPILAVIKVRGLTPK
jgi:protein gp37